MSDYPQERYIELENNPYLLGRITLHQVKEQFHAEVDIINKESHKIFKHVDIVYQQHTAEEALIVGVQRLRKFLDSVEKSADDSEEKPDILH
ncbi:hypothetical protein [Peredibacter starrii]|uniref:Uncharacterized protein n=1 Tax=Peredibacter starrii TaxID=28202 RepID=A0AAX4HTB2_9BACT|nr:hypothetical protein [Peredibacter starrii]WPU66447.1 hypothetical protein SOO65_06780 [Peredibacter starrii]